MKYGHSKRKSLLQALVESLVADHRRIAADWRILLLQRRATREIPEDQRRWKKAWETPWDARCWLVSNGDWEMLKPLDECDSLFVLGKAVTLQDPTPPSAIDVLIEANPAATLSHITALHFHGLTEDMPGPIHLSVPNAKGPVAPRGLSEEDLTELGPNGITCRRLKSVFNTEVIWHRLQINRMVGVKDYFRAGSHIRAMTPERALLEGLLSPESCGGLSGVFKSWAGAMDTIDLAHVIECVEAIDSAVLRQRVGYLLERCGIHNPAFELWAAGAKPGGSAKMDPNAPFGSITQVDPRWKLSINTDLLLEGNQ